MKFFDLFSQRFAELTGEQLKVLLETKHLYQKVSIQPDLITTNLVKKQIAESPRDTPDFYVQHIQKGLTERLSLTENPTFDGLNKIQLWLPVRNVKLFCVKCDAREAFRPIWFEDMTVKVKEKHRTQGMLGMEPFKIRFADYFQLFALVYQCQICESLPTAFLVKRVGTDLYLEGRSPIEHVELPKFIPKEEQKWFSDAVVAFQTGKILAALFYLRTFIEQFARRKTSTVGDKLTGDEILTAYLGTIPKNLRETMPSLAEWYDKLSEALHGAKEDAALFDSARQKIEEHFDIRRVHRLDEKEVPKVKKETKAD